MKLCECGCGEAAPIARLTNRRKGHVAGQAVRFIFGHTRIYTLDSWELDEATGCWIWQGKRDRFGYGLFQRRGRYTVAHRAVYERDVGPVPAGLELDHLCATRACVNPAHLEPVTHRENCKRAYARRSAPTRLSPLGA